MEPVEIRDIQYILAVWQERSISRAAEKCYISQPALSKIVKRVETGLGTAIFDRGSVPLRVTPEGEVFLDYFKRIKELYGEMEQYRADICREPTYVGSNGGRPAKVIKDHPPIRHAPFC